jgi:ketosteroid isomerase-like protein
MLFVLIINLIFILSCSKSYKNTSSDILLKTDRDFSAMSVENGMHEAFLHYIAEDGVVLRDNSFPVKGRESLLSIFSERPDTTFILSWEPLFAKISDGGDLGYTYGVYINTDKLTTEITRGTYITVWNKQQDGSWKFVLDTGTQGLPIKE